LAYCPERLSEGRALEEIVAIPHIVAGIDIASRATASALFRFLGGRVVLAPSIETAELAKVFDNVYRHVNIALANELALTSEKLGIDMLQAIALSNTSPRTNIMRPGLAGGSCLTKDPASLAYTRGLWDGPSLIVDAIEINNRLAVHILRLVKKAFHDLGKKVAGSTITVFGLAYKSGTDDVRNTMAKPLIDRLVGMGALVGAHDPYLRAKLAEEIFPAKFSNEILEAARGADCLIIATDHAEYERMKLKSLARVVRMPAGFVDARSQFNPERVSEVGFVYKGIGRP
jgi:UDP-N-acetyl-D-mannosaminuronic acid dehydrogenase